MQELLSASNGGKQLSSHNRRFDRAITLLLESPPGLLTYWVGDICDIRSNRSTFGLLGDMIRRSEPRQLDDFSQNTRPISSLRKPCNQEQNRAFNIGVKVMNPRPPPPKSIESFALRIRANAAYSPLLALTFLFNFLLNFLPLCNYLHSTRKPLKSTHGTPCKCQVFITLEARYFGSRI